jgi:serpin B
MDWWKLGVGIVLLSALSVAQEGAKDPRARQKLVAGMNAFACDLYGDAREAADGNLFLSPFAISTVGAVLSAGTGGQTEAEIRAAFRLPEGDALADTWPSLQAKLRKGVGPGMTLRFASAVCVEQTGPPLPEYQQLLTKTFSVPWYRMDFRGDPAGSVREINAWATRMAGGEGGDILETTDVKPTTRFLLVNASYFKGSWQDGFGRHATEPEVFHVDSERRTKVPTMFREVEQKIAQHKTLTVVPLAYRSSSVEMVLLVPKTIDGLAAVERELSPEKLSEWLGGRKAWKRQTVALYLPKFSLATQLDLSGLLSDRGVKLVFSPTDSDFSPMFGAEAASGMERPHVSTLVHSAGVRVDEKGTVAWSKTASTIDWGGGMDDSVTIRVDRPFLFLIRERRTGLILYLGRVVDPDSE